MSEQALAQLVTELFIAIKMMTGYPVPEVQPAIHRVEHAQLEAIACSNPCGVKALYVQGEGVFIDRSLDLEGDLTARSILLHELVHHIQGTSGRFDAVPACVGWYAREREAYAIQNRYLLRQGSTVNFHLSGGLRRCRQRMHE